MIAFLLAIVGVLLLVAAGLGFRSLGPAYRVGRLLAAAPEVTLEEATRSAHSGEERYVRVRGRVTSEEEFPDEHDRPLVYRRTRLETRGPDGRWTALEEDRAGVAFAVEARGRALTIDVEALGDGLVVTPRESVGVAADLPPERRAELAPDASVRLRVDQVSAVEQATAAGVPALGPDGQPMLRPGMGRPLILSTLEPSAAMRVLAHDKRRVVVASGAALLLGLGFLASAVVAFLVGA